MSDIPQAHHFQEERLFASVVPLGPGLHVVVLGSDH